MKEADLKTFANDIYNTIKCHNRFMITTHVRADGDAIGSETALYHALKAMGKSVNIVNDSAVPQVYKFIVPSEDMYIYPNIPKEQAEIVFTLDCPTLARLGEVSKNIPKQAKIINIDHHISNENFGHINVVTENVCATGELLLSIFKKMDLEISPKIATALYVAIVTDTGRFMHTNTTPEALRAAAFLIECGAKHNEISKNVYNTNSYSQIQLNAYVLNTVKLHFNNQIATVWVTTEMLKNTGVDAIDTQELADIPISIEGVHVGVLLREMTKPNWVKVSMRSRNGYDVNIVAKQFGGGGHKYAAGCELQGSILEVQKLILMELEKGLLCRK